MKMRVLATVLAALLLLGIIYSIGAADADNSIGFQMMDHKVTIEVTMKLMLPEAPDLMAAVRRAVRSLVAYLAPDPPPPPSPPQPMCQLEEEVIIAGLTRMMMTNVTQEYIVYREAAREPSMYPLVVLGLPQHGR